MAQRTTEVVPAGVYSTQGVSKRLIAGRSVDGVKAGLPSGDGVGIPRMPPVFDPSRVSPLASGNSSGVKSLPRSSAGIELDRQWKLRAKYVAPHMCLNLEPAAATYIPEAV